MDNAINHIPDPLVGQQLANFRIDGVIKRGGMSQVYKGWDVMLERPVAIKVVDSRFRDNPLYTERFLREARAVAQWRHPHIMQIYSADVQDGLYYFAMEYIDGFDLGELMARFAADGELVAHEDVLKIGWAVTEALAYAHNHGVIHRDVKPSNVMLSSDGRILLADFGLAMVVDQGTETEFLGTPHYIAPEQAIRAGNAVPQSDLYSLGVMLYEMLTGVTPFNDPSLTGLAFQHIHDPPTPPRHLNPNLSPEVEAVLLQALRKQPSDRFQSGDELMAALEEGLQMGERVEGGWVDWAPIPSGLTEFGTGSPLHLSKQTVVEKIANQLVVAEKEAARMTRLGGRWARVGWSLIWAALVIGFVWLLAWLWLETSREQAATTAVLPTPPATTNAVVSSLPTPIPVQLTPEPSPSPPPTSVIEPTVTKTAVSTPSPTSAPTFTRPPIPQFSGPPVQFIYDERSFYALNASTAPIEAAGLSFMAINQIGEPTGQSFLGRDWAKFYPRIEPGGCTHIEPIAFTQFLRPDICVEYNALVTPSLLDDTLFWLPREGVDEFAVFWNGQIVGRCAIDLGNCLLRLPS